LTCVSLSALFARNIRRSGSLHTLQLLLTLQIAACITANG
jgi:hypothetical protein